MTAPHLAGSRDRATVDALQRVADGLLDGSLSPREAVRERPELAPFLVVAAPRGEEFSRLALVGAADALGWGLDDINLWDRPGYEAGHRAASGADLMVLAVAEPTAEADAAEVEAEYERDVDRAVQLASDDEVTYEPTGDVRLVRDPYDVLADHARSDDVAADDGWGS